MAVARPIKVKGTGAAKLAPGSMVVPKQVVAAIQQTPGARRIRPSIPTGKGLGRAHIPHGGTATLPRFDVGSFDVQKQGPAQADPTAGIEQKVRRAIDQSGISTSPQAAAPTSNQATQTTPSTPTAPGSGYMGAGTPSQHTQATLPQSIGAIGGTGTGVNRGPGGGPSSQDLTNAAMGGTTQPPVPADIQHPFIRPGAGTPPAPGTGGTNAVDQGGRQYGQTGTNARGGAAIPGTFDYSQFSAANPPTLSPDQAAHFQTLANGISQTAMQGAQNPNYAGAWEGANPNSPMGQQVNAALSAINAQRQAAAQGGDWTAATWADLPENLRPPGATLPSFDVGTYGADDGTDAVVHKSEMILPETTASAVRSDPSVPSSGPVMTSSGLTNANPNLVSSGLSRSNPTGTPGGPSARMGMAGQSETPAQMQTRLDPNWATSHNVDSSFAPSPASSTPVGGSPDGARATTPAFNPATGGISGQLGGAGTGTAATNRPSGATLPAFLQRTQAALPAPNQIVARNWMRLDPNTQDLFTAAYENQGYSPSYLQWLMPQLLPGRAGVAPGTTGRILR